MHNHSVNVWTCALAFLPPYLPATRQLLEQFCRLEAIDGQRIIIRGPAGWIKVLRPLRQEVLEQVFAAVLGHPVTLELQPDPTATSRASQR